MGGRRDDTPANIITFCALFNGDIESDSNAAALARRYGWKLRPGQNPTEVPVYDRYDLTWYRLTNDGKRVTQDHGY
jgi:hypothetical protein